MKFNLGLVCISEMLKQNNKNDAFQTMTRKRFNDLPRHDAIHQLSQRILHNSNMTYKIIWHCINNNIKHYRISSNLFPLITDATLGISYDDLADFQSIKNNLQKCGDLARQHGVSISSHPDQFNVLPSFNEQTVVKSIAELNHQSFVLDLMGCPQDYRAPMCLHLNLSFDATKESISNYIHRFQSALSQCNAGVQKRLVLENEDKGFWNASNLHQYFGDFIPLVFDNLHDVCNPSAFCCFDMFRATWKHYKPVMHWSEGINNSRSHTDYVSHLPNVVECNNDCTWELEVKAKDFAILQVLNQYGN